MTYQHIRNMVEKESGFDDLSIHDTTDEISQIRLTYYKLCTMFMNDWSYNEIRETLNRRCVSTIGVGVKKFEYLKEQGELLRPEVYETCYKALKTLYKQEYNIKNLEVEYESV